jgi:hypothetical protein
MTTEQFEDIASQILECNNYLQGKIHSKTIDSIAQEAAKDAVEMHKDNLMLELVHNGLNIQEYV